ncbi:hypothetical protein YC2023_061204 [Brassica napus]
MIQIQCSELPKSRSVTAWDHIFSDHIFSDNIFSDCKSFSESVNGAKAGQNEAKEHSVTTEPSSSTELCLVKPADDLPSDEPSILILDKQRDDVAVTDRDMVKSSLVQVLCGSVRDELGVGLLKSNRDFNRGWGVLGRIHRISNESDRPRIVSFYDSMNHKNLVVAALTKNGGERRGCLSSKVIVLDDSLPQMEKEECYRHQDFNISYAQIHR